MSENNPLKNKMRVPKIYVRLPSAGKYNKIPVSFTSTGEIAVRAMTARDELLLRNPDALLNGDAVEKLITSCVPEIKDMRESPMNDIDLLLLAIKYATYGDQFKMVIKCPKCETENHNVSSIRSMIDSASDLPELNSITLDDGAELILRPYNFDCSNKTNLLDFENQKRFAMMQSSFKRIEDNDDATEITEKLIRKEMSDLFKTMADFNLNIMIESIIQINIMQEDVKTSVSNREHISEYVWDLDPVSVEKIKNSLKDIMKFGVDKKIHMTCTNPECKHEWDSEVGFDQSNFFVPTSEV